jgi:dTDP-4-amino-4,6-dideoxygalactose transaminase
MMSSNFGNRPVITGAQPYFGGALDDILGDIRLALESGVLSQGPKLAEFERLVAASVGSRYALGVSSGGTALELALKAMNVAGGEVIVPTNTFVASASSVILAGGKPVFCDIRRETLCFDPAAVERALSPRTVAVMPVHMFGLVPPDIEWLRRFCADRRLLLIEDASHAHGATWSGLKAGSLGNAGCFSFFATKVVTTGEGGVITTSDSALNDAVLRLRNHGKSLSDAVFEIPSNNYRLAEIPAILGIHQMGMLDAIVARRRAIAARYRDALAGLPGLQLLPEFPACGHSYWRFPAYLAPGIDRVAFQNRMFEHWGVRVTWMYEPLCHLQPAYQGLGQGPGSFPMAEECMGRLVCLPTHGGVSDEDVERVCRGVKQELLQSGAAG